LQWSHVHITLANGHMKSISQKPLFPSCFPLPIRIRYYSSQFSWQFHSSFLPQSQFYRPFLNFFRPHFFPQSIKINVIRSFQRLYHVHHSVSPP